MRRSYVQHPITLELIPRDEYTTPVVSAPTVIGDIGPYKSMITGEMIDGRAKHRDHLKRHGVVEVGNDLDNAKPKPVYEPGRLKEDIARQVYAKLRY